MKYIKIVFIAVLFYTSPSLAQKSTKPNILFIAIDDLKPIIGAYGNTFIKTPNIDRLAKRGTTFLNNYCQQAVCGPTRASLLTGMRPDITQIWDLKTQLRDVSPSIVTLPQYLITQGYSTQGIGKVFDPRNVDKDIDKELLPKLISLLQDEAICNQYAHQLNKIAITNADELIANHIIAIAS